MARELQYCMWNVGVYTTVGILLQGAELCVEFMRFSKVFMTLNEKKVHK